MVVSLKRWENGVLSERWNVHNRVSSERGKVHNCYERAPDGRAEDGEGSSSRDASQGGAVMASPQHQIIIFRDMYDEGQRNERSDCGGFIETSGKWRFIGTSGCS